MLIELRVDNHRSIGDEQALTMEAGRVGDPADPRPRQVSDHRSRVLSVAALYGANASGKSNFLGALAFLRDAVVLSHRVWPPEGGVPREPFAWGPRRGQPSLFEVTFLHQGVRYRYGFAAGDDRFEEEWLHAWPGGRKQTWFTRDADVFKFGDSLRGENRAVEKLTRANALFLSTAAQLRHAQLTPLYRWFDAIRIQTVRLHDGELLRSADGWTQLLKRFFVARDTSSRPTLADYLRSSPRRRERVCDLVRAADVGVVDLQLEDADGDPDRPGPSGREPVVMVRHHSAADDAWLPLDQESHGTRALLDLAPDLLDTLERGGLLVIDELEAGLHPLLALRVVEQFNDPRTNPRNAQLVFSTHDTNLLGTELGRPALRRDQIWLTEKDGDGATRLYPLTDYKPRKAENLERGYLQGRYGAIPYLGELARVNE